jgi:hypothetical protein
LTFPAHQVSQLDIGYFLRREMIDDSPLAAVRGAVKFRITFEPLKRQARSVRACRFFMRAEGSGG